jgi:hypothetical protein
MATTPFDVLYARLKLAQRELDDALADACAGPHRYVKHRDQRPPWCPVCHRTPRGALVEPRARLLPGDPRRG